MTPALDRPNLSLQVTAADGALLPARDALDRIEALRHELRGLDLVSVIAPAMPCSPEALPVAPEAPNSQRPASASADGRAAPLGAVEVAVLPPMLPALVDFLRCWSQRNAGAAIRLALLDGAGIADAPVDPAAITEACLAELLDRLWAQRESNSPPAASVRPIGRLSAA
jgi:hypothetical protein